MKLTKYKISLISLAMVLLIALSAFFGMQFFTAEATGSTSASNAFKTSGDNVKLVTAERTVSSTSGSDGTAKNYYLAFRFVNGEEEEVKDEDKKSGSYVYYNNKLAYNWFEQRKVEGTDTEGVFNGLFNMEFGFDDTNFERFVITFESQQYLKTKDGKTLNYVMFFPAGDDKVYVLVTQDKDATVEDVENKTKLDADHIRIKFTEKLSGAYKAEIYNQNLSSVLPEDKTESNKVEFNFENIGGNYSKLVTSGTTVYPLIFDADFKEDAAETANTAMVFYSLNGQELASSNGTKDVDTGYFSLGDINDKKPPVLCLGNDFTFFTQGSKVNFDYVVIDVLRTAATGKINYYVLDAETAKKGESFDYRDKDLFKEVGDNDLLETDYDAYLPSESDLSGTAFDPIYLNDGNKNTTGTLYADMLVKVYVHIYDTSSTSVQETADIYLDWYLDSNYLPTVNGEPFIAVAKDSLGVTYNYESKNDGNWEKIKADYQEKVNEAAKDLSAGSSNYFYLPSAEDLFKDKGTAYTDMKISIYYFHSEQNNNSNLATSNLSINVTKQGPYTFTLYATDAAGNGMYYTKDGQKVEFAASDIWTIFSDKERKDYLPWFTFNVQYTGAEFEEEPGLQSTGYVGTAYDSASFKINGVDYTTVYRLFFFNRDVYYKDTGKSFTYEEFIKAKDDLFNSAETRKYFTEIISLDKMEETDAEYEQFKDYNWSNGGTSFTPQEAGFYYMIAEVKDGKYETDPVTSSLAIVVSEAAKSLKGESDWLKNNLTSVILLTVAALALIGIVLLLVIKPKDKGDIDVRFEQKKNKKNK